MHNAQCTLHSERIERQNKDNPSLRTIPQDGVAIRFFNAYGMLPQVVAAVSRPVSATVSSLPRSVVRFCKALSENLGGQRSYRLQKSESELKKRIAT